MSEATCGCPRISLTLIRATNSGFPLSRGPTEVRHCRQNQPRISLTLIRARSLGPRFRGANGGETLPTNSDAPAQHVCGLFAKSVVKFSTLGFHREHGC